MTENRLQSSTRTVNKRLSDDEREFFFWKHEMRSDVLCFHHVCVQSWTAWMRLVTTEYQRMAHSWPRCSIHAPVPGQEGDILSPGPPWLSPGLRPEILSSSLERETEISAAVLCWSSGLAPGPGWKAAPLWPGSVGCVSASLSRCEEAHVPMSVAVMSWAMSSPPSQTWSAATGRHPPVWSSRLLIKKYHIPKRLRINCSNWEYKSEQKFMLSSSENFHLQIINKHFVVKVINLGLVSPCDM